MKRIFAGLLATCVLLAMAMPVCAAEKEIARIDKNTFSFHYDGPGEIVDNVYYQEGLITMIFGEKVETGPLELGQELRFYLNPADFVATDGTRMETLTVAALEKAGFFVEGGFRGTVEPNLFNANRAITMNEFIDDPEQGTVYISVQVKDTLPEPGTYEINYPITFEQRSELGSAAKFLYVICTVSE